MKNKVNRELAHRYIIVDYTIRTLEIDLARLQQLKTGAILQNLYEKALFDARAEQVQLRKQMQREKMKFTGEKRINENFTEFEFHQESLAENLRYANYAIRNQVFKAIERLLKQ